jgi:hypothetical protein
MSTIRFATRPHSAVTTLVCVASLVAVGCVVAPPATPAVPFRAHVTVSTRSTTVGHAVVAAVGRSTVPAGDSLRSIVVTWGDGSRPVKLAALTRKPTHRYQVPGRFTVRLKLVDAHAHIARASVPVVVSEPSGSYSGSVVQGSFITSSVSLFVSFSRKTLQDVNIGIVPIQCTPVEQGLPNSDELAVASISISAGGAFSATRVQHGVFAGQPAIFTYAFSGRFRPPGADGRPAASGTYRETIRFTDAVAHTCTSNVQSWTVERDVQPTQRATPPPVGSYSGSVVQGSFIASGINLFVSFDRKSLQDVNIGIVPIQCTPVEQGLPNSDELAFGSIPINASGGFSASRVQHGVFAGQRATFRYVFSGHYHSLAPNGAPRFAGMFRETITFTDTAARTCTSDNQTWTAKREVQPAQTHTPPAPGNYSGFIVQGSFITSGVTFTVPPSRTAVQVVSIPTVLLQCTPGGATPSDLLTIASTPVDASGAFSAVQTQTGVFATRPATFRFVFSGHYHSLAPNGKPRAAGMSRETVTFTDAAGGMCTSNDQAWTATDSG